MAQKPKDTPDTPSEPDQAQTLRAEIEQLNGRLAEAKAAFELARNYFAGLKLAAEGTKWFPSEQHFANAAAIVQLAAESEAWAAQKADALSRPLEPERVTH